MTTLHLIFKTHLDIGFTDLAANVREQYHERFIPQAIATAEHFFEEDPANPAFVWTTGAWLIADHLETQGAERVRRLERAIEKGLIRWHALPFTTHTELMSAPLFETSLSYSRRLDERFGVTTRAAKMTDVPGHTLGMVPIMARAGIRLLHLGVNTASPVPDVPPAFRWRAPGGEEIVVLYQDSYGGTQAIPGTDAEIGFAHTNDNMGPQSIAQTVEVYRALAHRHAGKTISASTLDAVADIVWPVRETLPLLTTEIGDSWIYGVGSDPVKTGRFKALNRIHDSMSQEDDSAREAFGRRLALVAEHTWGVDIKTFLRDEAAFDRPAFEAARRADPRFGKTEAAWAEQRAYLDAALEALDDEARTAADAALAETLPPASPANLLPIFETIELEGWKVSLDPATGDLRRITSPAGIEIAGTSLLGFRYESYDAAALERHLDTYLQHREEWAILDHAKPGLEHAKTARTEIFAPAAEGFAQENGAIAIRARLPDAAFAELGAPRQVETHLRPLGPDRLFVTLVLRDKPANRMPEAGFVHFTPDTASAWEIAKMGLWHAPQAIARRGGGQLQAIEDVRGQAGDARFALEPLDAPLLTPADTHFLPFAPEPPDYGKGVRFNLFNNKWGTNFTMWWEGDFVARLVLTLARA